MSCRRSGRSDFAVRVRGAAAKGGLIVVLLAALTALGIPSVSAAARPDTARTSLPRPPGLALGSRGTVAHPLAAVQTAARRTLGARAAASWSRQAELTAAKAPKGERFGDAVTVSGSMAVIGVPGISGEGVGAAYVFTRSGSAWKQQAKLTAADGAKGNSFGQAVALSGSTIVIGAPGTYQESAGAAYVFARSGSTWRQQAKLSPPGATKGENFGWSVAMSGATIVVGAIGQWGGSGLKAYGGVAYVFTESGTTWTQRAELTEAGSNGFGQSVAVSGSTIAVGSPESNNSDIGAAYVFTQSGTTVTERAELTASDGATGNLFGWSVALSDTTLVVGAMQAMTGGQIGAGAAYVFTQSGGTWSQQAKLTASNAAEVDFFGRSVAVSGSTVVIGAPGYNFQRGAAYIFSQSGTSWTQQADLVDPPATPGDYFGASVAVSGSTAIVGSPTVVPPASEIHAGAAYVYGGPPISPLTFREQGLADGKTACETAPWAVVVGTAGESCRSPGNEMAAITFPEAAGSQAFAVGAPPGTVADPACGSVETTGNPQTITVTFSPSAQLASGSAGAVFVCASGLPSGVRPQFTITPAGFPTSTGTPHSFAAATYTQYGFSPGNYVLTPTVACQASVCYEPRLGATSLSVQANQATAATVAYRAVSEGTLRIKVAGLPGGASAQVDVQPTRAGSYFGYAGTIAGARSVLLVPGTYDVTGADYCTKAGSCSTLTAASTAVTVSGGANSSVTLSYVALNTSAASSQAVQAGTQLGNALNALATSATSPSFSCLTVANSHTSPAIEPCEGSSGEAQDIASYLSAKVAVALIPCIGGGASAGSAVQSLLDTATTLPGESAVELQDGSDTDFISDVEFTYDATDALVDVSSSVQDGTCVMLSTGPQVIVTVIGFSVGIVISLVEPSAYNYDFSPTPLTNDGVTNLSVTSSYGQNESQVFCGNAYDETETTYCLEASGQFANPTGADVCNADTQAVPGAIVALSAFASDSPSAPFYDPYGNTVAPAGTVQTGNAPIGLGTQVAAGPCGIVPIQYQAGSQPASGAICSLPSAMTSTTILANPCATTKTLYYDDVLAFDPLKLTSPVYDYYEYPGG